MTSPTFVQPSTRKVVHRTRGDRHGPITRLMSPSDLGARLKPFVFLDLFEADMRALAGSMLVHPHSGIATVTVFTRGDVTFDDPIAGHGTIGYGGLEWARAGLGMWHGKELSAGSSPTVQGFQLWIALPPELERAAPETQYLGSELAPSIGPARLIVGSYETATSPVRAPRGINYLLVTLKPGQSWTYEPPGGHTVAWVAVAEGSLSGSERLLQGELVTFEASEASVVFQGEDGTGATFVLGSAVPHPYELHLGAYSVHTSAEALAAGERNLRELKTRLDATGDRRTASGSTPVFRG
ncbi:MAG TPA: pirin family protein [Vicinamibacteria bacterium]|nr:pirin family protein [Vicinamibacteria bacterium]